MSVDTWEDDDVSVIYVVQWILCFQRFRQIDKSLSDVQKRNGATYTTYVEVQGNDDGYGEMVDMERYSDNGRDKGLQGQQMSTSEDKVVD